jgi:hypothetical protein
VVAIGMGVVVLLVVIPLLASLVSMVKSIKQGVTGVRDTLRAPGEYRECCAHSYHG